MRKQRVIEQNRCYHLISRLAHRAFFLNEEERTRAVELMRRVEEFSGVMVLAYAFMSNHFHIFIYVPVFEEIDEAEILRRISILYRGTSLLRVTDEWERLKDEESKMHARVCNPAEYVSRFSVFKRSFTKRMCNSAEFMRTFKQHLTMSFNGRHEHFGTMWEGRYHDRHHPADEKVMWETAAYIDVNPVSAGIVAKAEDYAWSSFGAAIRGDEKARAGYSFIYGGTEEWETLKELHLHSIAEAWMRIRSARGLDGACDHADGELEARGRVDKATSNKDPELETPRLVPTLLNRGNNVVALKLLQLLNGSDMRPAALREALGINNRNYFNSYYLVPLMASGMIESTDPESRNSPRQSYRLTSRGRGVLAEWRSTE